MDRSLLIEDVPIKTSIYRGFPFAMFDYRRATSMMKTATCITNFVGQHLESFEKGRGYCVSVILPSLIECADILFTYIYIYIYIWLYIYIYTFDYIYIHVQSCTYVWFSDYRLLSHIGLKVLIQRSIYLMVSHQTFSFVSYFHEASAAGIRIHWM